MYVCVFEYPWCQMGAGLVWAGSVSGEQLKPVEGMMGGDRGQRVS